MKGSAPRKKKVVSQSNGVQCTYSDHAKIVKSASLHYAHDEGIRMAREVDPDFPDIASLVHKTYVNKKTNKVYTAATMPEGMRTYAGFRGTDPKDTLRRS